MRCDDRDGEGGIAAGPPGAGLPARQLHPGGVIIMPIIMPIIAHTPFPQAHRGLVYLCAYRLGTRAVPLEDLVQVSGNVSACGP